LPGNLLSKKNRKERKWGTPEGVEASKPEAGEKKKLGGRKNPPPTPTKKQGGGIREKK